MAVEFGLLGDIEVRVDGRPVDVGHAKQRCVLVALLVEANRPVGLDQLIDRVWGDRFPARVQASVRTYLTRLRQALAADGDTRIARSCGGYVLTVEPTAVDLHHFNHLTAQACRADNDDCAAALFEQAFELWRGEAFAGLDTPWVNSLRETLTAAHHAAKLNYHDVQLRRGQHDRLLATLCSMAAAHPLDERLGGQLMVALYRCGRQADALACHQRIRLRLAEELGVDPGPALQRLYHQILTADPALAVPATQSAGHGAVDPNAPVPRQLPAPPRLFTGRVQELAKLDNALQRNAALAISAVSGPGGVGKTWLALHWAHRHLDQFPDGQLYANLRGFDPSATPVPPAVVVRGFLDALGVAPAAIPASLEGKIGLYRSLTATKRLLVVLDNARDTAQVLTLLPGSATCTVLITSRSALGGLVTTHGALPLSLDVLDSDEARELLTRHLGQHKVTAEPGAAADLLDHCAGLPLALGIVAARATAQPQFPLTVLSDELHQSSTRLDALNAGELTVNLRAVLSWSYHALDTEAAGVFGLLGLVPGPDLSLAAVASLTALPAARARTVLRDLCGVHLVQEFAPGRYRMHDLVRLYSAEQALRGRPANVRTAALRRLVDFYLHSANAGDRLLDPHRPPLEIDRPASGCAPTSFATAAAALAWFDTEHPALLAAQQLSADQG